MAAFRFFANARLIRVVARAIPWGFGFALIAAHADPPPIVLVDASRAQGPALIYGTTTTPASANALHFVRLSPPLGQDAACCIRITGPRRTSHDLVAEIGQRPAAPTYARARIAPRQAPFMGIAFLGHTPTVRREDAHTLLLTGDAGQPARRLLHCLSTETLHVRVVDAESTQELLRYALPLGMDVEADCDEQLMPTRPLGSTQK